VYNDTDSDSDDGGGDAPGAPVTTEDMVTKAISQDGPLNYHDKDQAAKRLVRVACKTSPVLRRYLSEGGTIARIKSAARGAPLPRGVGHMEPTGGSADAAGTVQRLEDVETILPRAGRCLVYPWRVPDAFTHTALLNGRLHGVSADGAGVLKAMCTCEDLVGKLTRRVEIWCTMSGCGAIAECADKVVFVMDGNDSVAFKLDRFVTDPVNVVRAHITAAKVREPDV
jgi:hypothetical protein